MVSPAQKTNSSTSQPSDSNPPGTPSSSTTTETGSPPPAPRNESNPSLQTQDYFSAFNYASTLPSVNPLKIIYWGTSLSGGNVLIASALDHRIRACISQTPFVTGSSVTSSLGPKAPFIFSDLASVTTGTPSVMIPVLPSEPLEEVLAGKSSAILASPDIFPFLSELESRGIRTEKTCTFQTLLHMQLHEPIAFIERISPTPLLMVVGDRDTIIDANSQLGMFERARQPKEVCVLRDAGHFDVYYGEKFEESMRAQLEFLKRVV